MWRMNDDATFNIFNRNYVKLERFDNNFVPTQNTLPYVQTRSMAVVLRHTKVGVVTCSTV